MIECLPAPDRCELCGAELSEHGADGKAKRHEALVVLAMMSQMAAESPDGLIIMLLSIHPAKLTYEAMGALLGISKQAVHERMKHMDSVFAGWRPALDEHTRHNLDAIFQMINKEEK